MSHSRVSNIILLLCVTAAAKIVSISKVPKSLKGCISNTLYGRHTKFGPDLPERGLNTNKRSLWRCIILFGNHGNQHDWKWPLPPKSPIHSNVLNNQITATLFLMIGNKRYYVSWHMYLVLRHPILYNVSIVPIAYLIKQCGITNLVGWWLLQSSVGILTIDWWKSWGSWGKKLMFQLHDTILTIIKQHFLILVPIVWFVVIQTRSMATKMGMNWSLCEYSFSNWCLHCLIGACDKRDNEWSHFIRTRMNHI